MTVLKKFFEQTFLGNIEKKMEKTTKSKGNEFYFIIVSVIQHNLDIYVLIGKEIFER